MYRVKQAHRCDSVRRHSHRFLAISPAINVAATVNLFAHYSKLDRKQKLPFNPMQLDRLKRRTSKILYTLYLPTSQNPTCAPHRGVRMAKARMKHGRNYTLSAARRP